MSDLTDFLLARIAEDEAVILGGGGCDHWDRALAECQAKRLIVEDETSNEWQPLRYLATVYVNHPDYREEWKP